MRLGTRDRSQRVLAPLLLPDPFPPQGNGRPKPSIVTDRRNPQRERGRGVPVHEDGGLPCNRSPGL